MTTIKGTRRHCEQAAIFPESLSQHMDDKPLVVMYANT